jgi:phage terminase large subunit
VQAAKLQTGEVSVAGARAYYRTRPVEFINHWCDTFDPRRAMQGGMAWTPFLLFRKQEQLVEFLGKCLAGETSGLIEKSRDMGATWLSCAFSVWLWLFTPGASIGWGSRKQELVDRIGDPSSIFEKMRLLVDRLPPQFLPQGFVRSSHMTFMRILNPENGSSITGEVGDNIGRGGRTLIYFKDESAHYERPEMIEAALMDNTRVQIDMSSVNGIGNVFHRRREAGVDWAPGEPVVRGKTNVFIMDWRDHPQKDQSWYDYRRQKAEDDGLMHVFEQEVNRNYAAALVGVIIPPEWVKSAVDAHRRLGFSDDGGWCAGLDVADEGGDRNALAKRKGPVLHVCEEWGDRDVGVTTRRAIGYCSNTTPIEVNYDVIGVGSGVKAEVNRLESQELMPKGVSMVPWHAGAQVLNPGQYSIEGDPESARNKDLYHNLKAQAWWELRKRFEKTHRAIRKLDGDPVQADFTWEADELISLPKELPRLRKLEKELSQATVVKSPSMKLVVDKCPEGTFSPNLADAVVMAYWPANIRQPDVAVASPIILRPGDRRRVR